MSRRKAQAGFSLVELLAVVLVMAVLAAIAVPLYLNTRKDAAARTCKANIAAIAAAESAYATRFGHFCVGTGAEWTGAYVAGSTGAAPTGGLIGAPEGLTKIPTCPLGGASYTCTGTANSATSDCTITCGESTHSGLTQTLKPALSDTTNPL